MRTERSIVPGVCLGAWLFLAVCRSVAAGDLDPVLVGQYPPHGEGRVEDIAISGDYAYVAFGGAGLQILDIRNPAAPHLAGAYDLPGRVMRVAGQGSYAYLRLDKVWGLQVLDVSNPTTPRLVAIYRSEQEFNDGTDLAVAGDYACLSPVPQIELIDISNPQRPSLASISDFPSGGGAVAFVADGNIICAARSDRTLEVIDISDPTQPQVRGTCNLPANPNHGSVVVSGNYVYVGGVGLTIVDISDPAQSRPLGGIDDIASGGSRVAASGDHAYVVDHVHGDDRGSGRLQVLDVTNAAAPSYTGEYKADFHITRVKATDEFAHLLGFRWNETNRHERSWYETVDVSNPANPQRVGAYDLGDVEHYGGGGLAISGTHAYVTTLWRGGTNYFGRLQVLDISNPASPHPTGELSLPGVWDVAVSGPYACVLAGTEDGTSWASGFDVIDSSDPANPHRVGAYTSAEPLVGLAMSGQYAYVGAQSWSSGSRLLVIDISNPANPREVGRCTFEGFFCWRLAASGRYACMAGWEGGVLVIDISDPARPRRVGRWSSRGQTWDLTISGQYVYAADAWLEVGMGLLPEGLVILDLENPACLQRMGNLELPPRGNEVSRRAVGVAVSGSSTYVASNGEECDVDSCHPSTNLFHAIDTSDPTSPQLVGECDLHVGGWGATTIAISDQTAYVAGHNFEVIDISQPPNPQRVDGCPGLGGGWYGQIATLGGQACVVGDGMLRVFDVSDPTSPQLEGECPDRGMDIALAGNYAYVPGAGVEVFDIRDPAHPRRVGGNSPLDAHALAIADGRLHVAAGEQGLVILNLYEPTRFESVRLDAEGLHLLLRGPTGQMLRVERSTDLLNWAPFVTVPIPCGGQTLIDPAATSEPVLFYRAVAVP